MASLSRNRKRLASTLFFLIIAINVMDRQMVAILAESMKADLGLSDAALGALAGPLFAFSYAVSGLPIAFITDRTDRVRVLGWSTAIAGVFAASSGFARGFGVLAGARALVAIGDAGGPPAIWSLVSSYHAPEKRARIIANIQLGAPVGAVIAFVVGGLVASTLGWRWGFFIVGGLGIIAGLACLFLVPEPRRDSPKAQVGPTSKTMSPFNGYRDLISQPAFQWGLCGVSLAGVGMFGLGIWAPSVLQREFGWSPGQTGIALGGATALAGSTGTWASGWLAERKRKNGDLGAEFTVPALAMIVAVPVVALSGIAPSAMTALITYGAATFCLLAWNAPSIAAFQLIANDQTRAVAASLHVFFVNMFGLGLGPLAIGFFSEALMPSLGVASLSTSIAIIVTLAVTGAAVAFRRASHHLRRAPAQDSLLPNT